MRVSLVLVHVFGVRLEPDDVVSLWTDACDQREGYEHVHTEPPYHSAVHGSHEFSASTALAVSNTPLSLNLTSTCPVARQALVSAVDTANFDSRGPVIRLQPSITETAVITAA